MTITCLYIPVNTRVLTFRCCLTKHLWNNSRFCVTDVPCILKKQHQNLSCVITLVYNNSIPGISCAMCRRWRVPFESLRPLSTRYENVVHNCRAIVLSKLGGRFSCCPAVFREMLHWSSMETSSCPLLSVRSPRVRDRHVAGNATLSVCK